MSQEEKISSGKLSVKYVILNKIVAVNWVPTTHSSDVATGLGRVIYARGSKTKMDFGVYIFEQTVKHAKIDAVKFPIAFPSLLCSIILDQHPNIKTVKDIPNKRESPLTLHQKLFGANHVPDIVGTSENVPVAGLMTKQEIVAALKDTCVMLDERKIQFELMIHSLEREDAAVEDEQAESEEEDDDADKGQGDEEASGSSSEDAEWFFLFIISVVWTMP